jgi:RND family efflux transporter MFP subunit
MTPHPKVLFVIALLAAGCGGGREEERGGAIPPAVKARLAKVEDAAVAKSVELPGTVESERAAEAGSRVTALVTAVRVRVGDRVRRGQVLVEIDPQTAAGQVGQARGGLAQAEAALALAERNHERFRALADADAASALELDQARAQHDLAKGAVETARGAVAAASSVAAESRVTAPFDGYVTARTVEVGDLAAPGRPLVRIESVGARRLALALPESAFAAARLRVGDRVTVAVDARPDLGRFPATVAEIAPNADPLAHAVAVKLGLGALDVPPGAYGRAWIATGERRALSVPEDAVVRQGGTTLVVVRDEKGTAFSRVVTVGEALPGGRIEILSGLAGGETVLTGLAAVPPLGARVEEVP